MSLKINKYFKKIIYIITTIFSIYILSYVIKFIMQLGRIVGTIIRLIMNL